MEGRRSTVRVRARIACLGLAAGAAVALAQPALAASAPATGFVGVNAGILMQPGPDVGLRPGAADQELGLMARIGVRSLRLGIWWKYSQPYPTWEAIPPAQRGYFVRTPGAPTSFVVLDVLFAAAARHGVTLLPVLVGAPAWGAVNPEPHGEVLGNPPRDPSAFAAWAGAVVRRYGSRGTFWAAHPRLPRRPPEAWQVWNEPNIRSAWSAPGWVKGYAALLRAAAPAIRAADPGAKVVLAGLTNDSWTALRRLYGAVDRRDFDIVDAHPYTRYAGDVVKILRRVRAVMARHGDARRPLWVGEIGWPLATRALRVSYGIETDLRGQLARLDYILPALARRRAALRLGHVYWENWLSRYTVATNPFDFAGLRRLRGGRVGPAPSFDLFRRLVARVNRR